MLINQHFLATLSKYKDITADTDTKVTFQTEVLDTDNCFDNSSTYRFTPTTAGKWYFIFGQFAFDSYANARHDCKFIKMVQKLLEQS